MKFSFDHNSAPISVDLTPIGTSYRATIGEQEVNIEIVRASDGKLDLWIDNKRVVAYVSSDNTKRWVTINGQTLVLTKSSEARRGSHAGHHTAGELTAPMPGQVRTVNVREGDTVTKGQTLLVLEAMKMEIRIQAPQDGVVTKSFVEQGQTVEREQILMEIEQD
ncbi:MAG TPA: biotin/lipoyl-containing protein [Anaerolineales bacterium]|nr:biotin/lipoyl-containing protein [Anaerolineales bacterium]